MSRDCYMGDPYFEYEGYSNEPVQNEAQTFHDQRGYDYGINVVPFRDNLNGADDSGTEVQSHGMNMTQAPEKNPSPELPLEEGKPE